MSQHDYALADQAGLGFLADINDALAAIVSQNSGATAPSPTFAYQLWADTTSGWLKQRNAANSAWIERLPLAAASANIASAATLNLDAATSAWLRVTGTTTTTAVTLADGSRRTVVAAAAWPLTHGASLILPGAVSYTCAAGDILHFFGESGGVVRVEITPAATKTPAIVSQAVAEAGTDTTAREWTAQRVAQAIAAQGSGKIKQIVSSSVTPSSGTSTIPSDDTVPTSSEGTQVWSSAITPSSASNSVKVNGTINIGGTGSMYVAVALFRGTTCIWAAEEQVPNAVVIRSIPINVMDAPATTSATTYSLRCGAIDGTGTWSVSDALTARLGSVAGGSTIELMEIAP